MNLLSLCRGFSATLPSQYAGRLQRFALAFPHRECSGCCMGSLIAALLDTVFLTTTSH